VQHQAGVEPEARHRLAGERLADRVLVLVVREDQVLAAGVDVELLAQVLRGHRRALDVPPRPHVAPVGLVGDPPAQLGEVRAAHQGEVVGVVLLVVVHVHRRAGADARAVDAAQPAVGGEAGDVEVDRTVPLVGQPLVDQLLRQLDHVGDVLGRPRVVICGREAQRRHVVEELLGKLPGQLLEPHAAPRRLADRLVVDVREIDDVPHLVAVVEQQLLQHVDGEQPAEEPEVRVGVKRRAAGVDADAALGQRPQELLPPRRGVVQSEHRPPQPAKRLVER
jgi:hypothetical protein